MKYVSIDLETTGLDPERHQIVEFGAVATEHGDMTPIDELPKFRAVILREDYNLNYYCAQLHKDLWEEIGNIVDGMTDLNMGEIEHLFAVYYGEEGEVEVCKEGAEYSKDFPCTHYIQPKYLQDIFNKWLAKVYDLKAGEPITINIAGKNPAMFDIPFLNAMPEWLGHVVKFERRVMDPAILYMKPEDVKMPNLQKCLRRAGLEGTVQHTAVDDAIDIVRLIRAAE